MRFRAHMKAAGLVQEKLADRLNVSQGTIAHWLSGRRAVNLADFFRLAEAAAADPAYLLFGDSEELAMLNTLTKFLSENPTLQKMIAQPATPPIIAAAALPPAPPLRPRKKVAARKRRAKP